MAPRVSSPVFVGRAAELAQLRAALERALAGSPATVVVAGEAGVGKTRLTGELLGHAHGLGVLTLTGGCLDVGDGVVAFAPIVEALRSLTARLTPEELEHALGHARAELSRLVPELGGPVTPVGTLTPGRLFELLLGVLHRLAETRAVLLVVEDLHWADESTRHLLGFLVRNLRGGVALVATYRSDELHRRHPLRGFLAELERSGRAERVELGPLDRFELAELLAGILGEPPPAAVVGEILARSEGNPFFAEELVAARAEGVKLPDVLRDVLLARVESLPEATQRVLRVAAVAGRQVGHELLAEVAGSPSGELVDLVRDAVTHHVLVVQDGGEGYSFRHALVQEAIYDDLLPVQRTPLHAACARALAARAGQPAGRHSVAVLSQLARHWYAAHDLGEALVASVRAGQAAEDASALPEAEQHYQRALELWDRVPEAAERSPLDRMTVLRRAAQAMALVGDAHRAVTLVVGALEETDPAAEPLLAGALLERLARYHWLVGDSDRAMEAVERAVATVPAAPPTPERARVLAAHGQMLMLLSRNQAARQRCEEAVAVARQAGARAAEGHALNTLGAALSAVGHTEAGIASLERAYVIAKELGDPDDLCRAPFNLSHALMGTGRCAEAVRMALECVEWAGRSGQLRNMGMTALDNGAEALVWLGRWEEAVRLLDRAYDIDRDLTVFGGVWPAGIRLLLWRGELAAARVDALRALEATWARDPQLASPRLSLLATVATWEGRPEEARTIAARALEVVAGTDDARYVIEPCLAGLEAEAAIAERAAARRDTRAGEQATTVAADLLGKANAAASAGDAPPSRLARAMLLTAEAHHSRVTGASDAGRWAAAVAAWDGLDYPWPAAHARWRQAEALLAAGGSRDQAAPVLREAWETSSRLGARLLTAEVQALARRARIELDPAEAAAASDGAASPAPTVQDDLGLTPREREVLALVADGRTNRQIAEALYISDKTASVHVSNILGKLGVANRAEAAVAAHRLGVLGAPGVEPDRAPGRVP